MPKRYKEARLMHKAKLTEMAAKLGVSQPTLSAWESERKAAPVEAVIRMAELYGVTTDYLLGRDDHTVAPGEPIPEQCLKLFLAPSQCHNGGTDHIRWRTHSLFGCCGVVRYDAAILGIQSYFGHTSSAFETC